MYSSCRAGGRLDRILISAITRSNRNSFVINCCDKGIIAVYRVTDRMWTLPLRRNLKLTISISYSSATIVGLESCIL
jgi:hypothetical protein